MKYIKSLYVYHPRFIEQLTKYRRFIPYCQVVEANNGQEALNLLDHIKPHLILSDVMMPGKLLKYASCMVKYP